MASLFAHNSYEIYEALLGEEHPESIEALALVGIYEYNRKKYEAAEHYTIRAILVAKCAFSEAYPELLIMLMNLSSIYEAQKKFSDAIIALYMALNICFKIYTEKHAHTAILFAALAALHF